MQTEKYPVGHMVYLEKGVLEQLQKDIANFIDASLQSSPRPLR
jgi:hypothetical protein